MIRIDIKPAEEENEGIVTIRGTTEELARLMLILMRVGYQQGCEDCNDAGQNGLN